MKNKNFEILANYFETTKPGARALKTRVRKETHQFLKQLAETNGVQVSEIGAAVLDYVAFDGQGTRGKKLIKYWEQMSRDVMTLNITAPRR